MQSTQAGNGKLTWLHLSDLHACPKRTGWDAQHITKSLVDDLKDLQRRHGIRPDLIFFTGDLAYGHLSDSPLVDQYKVVHEFIESVRTSFQPELSPRDIYVVPGNHDVNKDDIDPGQTAWLKSPERTLTDVVGMMHDNKRQWKRFAERLDDYRAFLEQYGYDHLLTDEYSRLIYSDAREINGLRVGIMGLNSAWSCTGGHADKGQIWCAGRFQSEQTLHSIQETDFKIALLHHPSNWFVPAEDPDLQRYLDQTFELVLHGHEHQGWVRTDRYTSHTTISAGACYDRSDKRNGYSLVQLDARKHTIKMWLREYRENGRGWVRSPIPKRAPDGILTMRSVRWLRPIAARLIGDATKAAESPAPGTASVSRRRRTDPARAAEYEQRFCNAVTAKFDYLELFGADVPREAQRHKLSVAYVSLNLTPDDSYDEPSEDQNETPLRGIQPVGKVLDSLSEETTRLLIRGVAGGGKSTLLRWAAISAASNRAAVPKVPTNLADQPDSWRTKIPFLIRLRDFPDGVLPRPKDLPSIIARELPDPPDGWVDDLLQAGGALLLFDGVDEVPATVRPTLEQEIENLLNAYPKNICIVSTRPGAVSRGWLGRCDFTEAQIEPLTQQDQAEFIDKWFAAVRLELQGTRRRAENLEKLASDLKAELRETPSIARLANFPLLCAMICALYRERNQRLPETQTQLCEDLCKMLLHRRERETPDARLLHLPPAYRKLDYEQKKYVIADLARFMVDRGLSSVSTTELRLTIQTSLSHFSGVEISSVAEMAQAFVERSGLLRPSGVDRIEFVHNTLKEYLAASRFVADGQTGALVAHVLDDAWQPVILFATALPTPDFASELVSEIFADISRDKKARRTPARTAAVRAKEFFLLKARTSAFRLDPTLEKRIGRLAATLFPPNTIADAEALATLGEPVLSLVDPARLKNARQRVATIRLLRLIGGERSASLLGRFAPLQGKPVVCELLAAGTELGVPVRVGARNVDLSDTSVQGLSALQTIADVVRLDISGTRITDLSFLRKATHLKWFSARGVRCGDVSPLASARGLTFLDLTGMPLAPLTFVGKLKELQLLRVGAPTVIESDASPWHMRYAGYFGQLYERLLAGADVAGWIEIAQRMMTLSSRLFRRSLLRQRLVYDLTGGMRRDPVAGWIGRGPAGQHSLKYPEDEVLVSVREWLEHYLGRRPRPEGGDPRDIFSAFAAYLARRFPGAAALNEWLKPLAGARELLVLDVSTSPIVDAAQLGNPPSLRALFASNCLLTSVEPLARMKTLQWLDVSGCPVEDVSPLKELSELEILDVGYTPCSDLSWVSKLKNLKVINITGTRLRKFEWMFSMPNLRVIVASGNDETGQRLRTALKETANRRPRAVELIFE